MLPAWNYVHLSEVDSTNNIARELPIWSAVRADTQQAGRGQRGRSWHSAPGGLWASYVLPSNNDPAPSIKFGAALVLALRSSLTLPELRLKYPNDLYLGSKKLGGILIEKPDPDRFIVGIGINVNNPLPDTSLLNKPATSLSRALAAPPSRSELFLQVADILMQALSAPIAIHQAWAEDPIQVKITTHNGTHQGTFLGTSSEGSPIVKTENGELLELAASQILSFEES